MNSAALFQTCLGFGSGLILGEVAHEHSLKSPDKVTQEKTKSIALAALGLGGAFCSYIFPNEVSPIFSGIALGTTTEIIIGARKSTIKELTYANILAATSIFLFLHDQQPAIPFFPLIFGLVTTSFLKQDREDRMMQQMCLLRLDVANELHAEYEQEGDLELEDNPMLCGDPLEVPLDPVLIPNNPGRVYDRKSVNGRAISLSKYKNFVEDCLLKEDIDITKMREAIAEFRGYQTPGAQSRMRSRSRTRT